MMEFPDLEPIFGSVQSNRRKSGATATSR